jgi:hypothetical protein
MTETAARGLRLLRVLLCVAIAESSVHYLDNTVRFDDYRGPNPPAIGAWITRWMIPTAWMLFTVAGVIGYRRFRDRDFPHAAAWLGAYSASGLISVLHYTGISVGDLSVFQNTFVFADVALGVAMLSFALWTALRRGAQPPSRDQSRGAARRSTDAASADASPAARSTTAAM